MVAELRLTKVTLREPFCGNAERTCKHALHANHGSKTPGELQSDNFVICHVFYSILKTAFNPKIFTTAGKCKNFMIVQRYYIDFK